ncbi:MAG: hypothetical protein SCJ94_12065 [Bacillota bacterium]|nr:hypothetical protein [Bacillota bacterium]
MKRTIAITALAMVFLMTLAVPAFAQSLSLTTTYDMEGTINLQKQAGHLCNTGAEVKQTIVGNGTMQKAQTINMIEGRIMMEDDNNWVAGATPLTVTTVWELCAPPKYVYDDSADYADDLAVPLSSLFPIGNGDSQPKVATVADTRALTSQIWAVQVQADPGFSGSLYQNAVAANGPFYDAADEVLDSNADLEWIDSGGRDFSDHWRWNDGKMVVGSDYIGSYFDIEQHARTSQGTLRRYIDISSPFNHGYLMENMSVVGKSDVQETFAMQNLPAGSDIVGDWWNLF